MQIENNGLVYKCNIYLWQIKGLVVVEPPLSFCIDGTNFFLWNVFYLKLIVHQSSHIFWKIRRGSNQNERTFTFSTRDQ